jgi:hypothetical protein
MTNYRANDALFALMKRKKKQVLGPDLPIPDSFDYDFLFKFSFGLLDFIFN